MKKAKKLEPNEPKGKAKEKPEKSLRKPLTKAVNFDTWNWLKMIKDAKKIVNVIRQLKYN